MIFFVTLSSYGQESQGSAITTNLTDIVVLNDTRIDISNKNNNHTLSEFSIPANHIVWNIGIFAIIGSALTLIGILLTLRFIYIDREFMQDLRRAHNVIAKSIEIEEESFDKNDFKKVNIRWFAESIGSYYEALELLRIRRRQNKHYGLRIDFICMVVLFITGSVATLGVFADEFFALLLIIGFFTILPVIHFAIQLNGVHFGFKFDR